MSNQHDEKRGNDKRIPFRVCLNPEQVVEICRRRNERAELRTIADLVEDGLALVLGGTPLSPPATEGRAREVELFCLLAEGTPGALRGTLRSVYERVREDNAYWIFPSIPWRDDAPQGVRVEPYLDQAALRADWDKLLEAAQAQSASDAQASDSRKACHA